MTAYRRLVLGESPFQPGPVQGELSSQEESVEGKVLQNEHR